MMQFLHFTYTLCHGDSEGPTPSEAEASLTVTVKHSSTWDVVRYNICELLKLDICEFYIRENIVFTERILETGVVMYMCVCIVEYLYKEGWKGERELDFLKLKGEVEFPELWLDGRYSLNMSQGACQACL